MNEFLLGILILTGVLAFVWDIGMDFFGWLLGAAVCTGVGIGLAMGFKWWAGL